MMMLRSLRGRARLHTCSACISVSADVSLRGVLRPAPIMRQIDHALWMSGLGKHLAGEGGGDAFCVAQSVHLEPFARRRAGLPQVSVLVDGSELLRGPLPDPALRIATWVESVGASSVSFGSACTSSSGEVFALASRKFVRVGESGRPVNWTGAQSAALDAARSADEAASRALLSAGGSLPAIQRLSPPAAEAVHAAAPILRTVALPSRIGSGGHLDHAALLEWAHDAHVLCSGAAAEDEARPLSACISYLGQARRGDEVEVLEVGGGAGGGPLLLTRRVDDGAALALARISS